MVKIQIKWGMDKVQMEARKWGNGGTSEVYLAADVRKMPARGFGVYADKFVKGKRVMTLPQTSKGTEESL